MPVVSERCVGCGECAAFCPVHAIRVCGRAVVGKGCTQCGLCVRYCPVQAIRVEG
ncbi:4Fe-4S binding protein [Methermicoccus shengliensis]|uniref:4Fe-4S binding protein n=1 Tax=Methermicoccus shengliensis TaxID=660064 RepID=A0A832RUE0_9EURY|nr:4Fe-4S binding protein [Methermicoccus shengliensis]HIH69015.1 4Fe-4S binding protein [Methermicoccus shengliensis]